MKALRFIAAGAAAVIASLLLMFALRDSKVESGGRRDIGQVAPEIIGQDINGNPMKLSDFRGKIVVLDFFGDW